MSAPAAAASAAPSPAADEKKASKDTVKREKDLVLEHAFECRPQDLFDALTNEKFVSSYMRSPAKIEAKVGGAFSMLDKSVVGTFTKVNAPSELEMSWRSTSWDDGVDSTVSIKLAEIRKNVVKMTIEHKNIPVADRCGYDGQFSRTNEFWKLYFKENITKIVGFRQASLTEEDSDDD